MGSLAGLKRAFSRSIVTAYSLLILIVTSSAYAADRGAKILDGSCGAEQGYRADAVFGDLFPGQNKEGVACSFKVESSQVSFSGPLPSSYLVEHTLTFKAESDQLDLSKIKLPVVEILTLTDGRDPAKAPAKIERVVQSPGIFKVGLPYGSTATIYLNLKPKEDFFQRASDVVRLSVSLNGPVAGSQGAKMGTLQLFKKDVVNAIRRQEEAGLRQFRQSPLAQGLSEGSLSAVDDRAVIVQRSEVAASMVRTGAAFTIEKAIDFKAVSEPRKRLVETLGKTQADISLSTKTINTIQSTIVAYIKEIGDLKASIAARNKKIESLRVTIEGQNKSINALNRQLQDLRIQYSSVIGGGFGAYDGLVVALDQIGSLERKIASISSARAANVTSKNSEEAAVVNIGRLIADRDKKRSDGVKAKTAEEGTRAKLQATVNKLQEDLKKGQPVFDALKSALDAALADLQAKLVAVTDLQTELDASTERIDALL